jgi:glutamate racemase
MGSAAAVAAQALRRLPAGNAGSPGSGTVRVLLSGRMAALPPAALQYPEGRLLAPLVQAVPLAQAMPSVAQAAIGG